MNIKIRILALITLTWLLNACNVYRIVPERKYLLRKNKTEYQHQDIIKPSETKIYILQQPNFTILGYPILVGIYSIADPNPELHFNRSVKKHPKIYKTLEKIFSKKQAYFQLKRYYINLNKQIQKFGEPPVIIDSNLTEKSKKNLHLLFKNNGFLDNRVQYQIVPRSTIKADVNYLIKEGNIYSIDSISWNIESDYIKKLFKNIHNQLKTQAGKHYNRNHLAHDRELITNYLRNNGLYDFQSSYINYDIVRTDSTYGLNIYANIFNKVFQKDDSIFTKEFLPYKYLNTDVIVSPKRTPVFTPDSISKKQSYDSVRYYFQNNRFFRPDLLSQAILIKPGKIFSDQNVNLTRKQLYFLDNFKQVYISHQIANDTTLNARIVLLPLKRFSTNFSVNATNSNTRPLGLASEISFTWRNLFHGFENLQFSLFYNQAISKRFSTENTLFNVSEISADLNLKIPRFLMPYFKKFVPLHMRPKTIYSLRYITQTNIGLDRDRFYAVNSYEWKPSHPVLNLFTPFEVNYVNYKNPERYFEIYTTAFNTLNQLSQTFYNTSITPQQADNFIDFVLLNEPPNSEIYQTVKKIYERKIRLTENVFIINTHHALTYDTRRDIWDNHFYLFRFYGEIAGWLPGAVSKFIELPRNVIGQRMINKIPYAQYFKGEFTFIRHWDFGKKRILAYRFFTGLAVPYGNSTNIPFVSAYFAGGSNDIRAWRAFELGPGSTGGLGEFNEANFKVLTNIEYRMPFYENHHLGLFADAGNIWNLFDDIPYREAKFKGIYSLLYETAIGAGIGYRYDFSIFALRIDWAFKIFDPGRPEGDRWIKNYSINQSILQFGINYPF